MKEKRQRKSVNEIVCSFRQIDIVKDHYWPAQSDPRDCATNSKG